MQVSHVDKNMVEQSSTEETLNKEPVIETGKKSRKWSKLAVIEIVNLMEMCSF